MLGVLALGTSVWYGYRYLHGTTSVIMLADFDSVEGLHEGSPVKISGVVVGSVQNIRLDKEGYSAIVSFSVDKSIPLPRDTVAAIVSESLLGGKLLTLIPGSEEDVLVPGDTISLTQSPMNLEGMIQKLIFNVEGDRSEKSEGEGRAVETPQTPSGKGASSEKPSKNFFKKPSKTIAPGPMSSETHPNSTVSAFLPEECL